MGLINPKQLSRIFFFFLPFFFFMYLLRTWAVRFRFVEFTPFSPLRRGTSAKKRNGAHLPVACVSLHCVLQGGQVIGLYDLHGLWITMLYESRMI